MPKHTPGNTLGLYEDNKETFAPYPYLRKALEVMRAQILQAKLRISVSHENLPGEPIRVRITCKNTARFYYRIIRVVGAAEAAYSSVLIPILAMAISTLFEDYRWTPLAIAGGLTAIAGLLTALGARRPVSDAAAADAGEPQPLRR